MKLMIKCLLLVLVLGLAGPFFLKKPDGTPWMDARQLLPDVKSWQLSLTRWWRDTKVSVDVGDGVGSAGKTTVYRWQTPDGSWQFSDTPPQGVQVETVSVDPDRNLIEGVSPQNVEKTEKPAAETPELGVPLPLTVSPKQAKQLIEDAKGVQKLMDQRAQALDNI